MDELVHEQAVMNKNGNNNSERVATIGGTFDSLHAGHKEYIRLALEYADRVRIYLNADSYTNGKKHYTVKPYIFRFQQIMNFIKEIGCEERCEIRQLYHFPEDVQDDYLNDENLKQTSNLAIVSPEYYEFFLTINREREEKCMKGILILVKPRTRDQNNRDISSSVIRNNGFEIESSVMYMEPSL